MGQGIFCHEQVYVLVPEVDGRTMKQSLNELRTLTNLCTHYSTFVREKIGQFGDFPNI
jgi:hypothetical protein